MARQEMLLKIKMSLLKPSPWKLCTLAPYHRAMTLITRTISKMSLLGRLYQERGRLTCTWRVSLRDLFHTCCVLKAEFTEEPRGGKTAESKWVRGGLTQLERVASRGRFVIFVALQGERRNANVKVGAVGSLDAERPPEHKHA